MRRHTVLVAPIVYLLLITASVQAQGPDGDNLSSWLLSSPSRGIFRGGTPCYPDACPNPSATFRIGWVDDERGVRRDFQTRSVVQSYHWPLRGLWLGGAIHANFGPSIGVALGGGGLVASKTRGGATLEPGGDFAKFDSPNLWTQLEILGRYSLYRGVSVVGGFRWDYFNVKLDASTLPGQEGLVGGARGSVINTKWNAYLPLVGVQLKQPSTVQDITVQMLGFPYVPGNEKSQSSNDGGVNAFVNSLNFEKGYFLEILGEYSRRIAGNGSVGGFVRWNLLHTETVDGTDMEIRMGVPGTSRGVSIGLTRRSWTIGLNVSVAFSLL